MHQLKYYRVIRILQVEGSDRHAERARLQLYASGLRCAIQRVRSHEDYVSALALRWADVLLIGGGLGTLDALSAERIAMERASYLPIVFATTDRLADLGLAVLGSMLQARDVHGRREMDAGRRAA